MIWDLGKWENKSQTTTNGNKRRHTNEKERRDMSKQEIVKIFGDRKIRSVWDDEAEKRYFSVVDVVAVLTESENPRN